jgi:hypothetical protein
MAAPVSAGARRFEPTDHSAVFIAGVGLAIAIFTWIPAALFTAPMALARVRAWERGRDEGRFDPGEQHHFIIARIMAWVSLLFCLPALFFGVLFAIALLAH